MSEVKNEGLEVAAWQARFIETNDWRKCTKEHHDFVKANQSEWPDYEVRQLCRHSEALAGYAVRDARISDLGFELEVARTDELSAAVWAATETIKHDLWDAQAEIVKRNARIAELELPYTKMCERMWELESERDQLRAELADLNAKLDASKFCANVADDLLAELVEAKETISRYEVTAENCDVLRAELANQLEVKSFWIGRTRALEVELAAIKAQGVIDFVFSGELPNATFVEVEDGNGNSINVGEWLKREDGYSVLRLYAAPVAKQVVMQSTNFTASNGEQRNPRYQGQFEGETHDQAAYRLHWVTAAIESERLNAAPAAPAADAGVNSHD